MPREVRPCGAHGCTRPYRRNGFCDLHSNRMKRNGSLDPVAEWARQTEEGRFWSKVDRGSAEKCWRWTGPINNQGYGVFETYPHGNGKRQRTLAHRYALGLTGADIAEKVVRHACDNPRCVNPHHLTPGTQRENMHDAIRRGRLDMSGLAVGQERQRSRPLILCGCGERAHARGMCKRHYMRWWKERAA